jgi:hypothetical protein
MTNSQSQLFCPDLCSTQIIKQYSSQPLRFFCYAKADYEIELWSNLTIHKQWIAFPLTKTTASNEYQVNVNTLQLPPGDYEFTYRFKSVHGNENWSWYGAPTQNGRIHIVPRSGSLTAPSFANVPQLRLVANEHTRIVDLWHFRTQVKQVDSSLHCFSLGKINHTIQSYVSFLRKGQV